MALSDCYMLRDIQKFNGELFMNVFFYQDLLLASTAENVVDSYQTDVIPKVIAMQQSSCDHIKIDAVNLADPSNFFEDDTVFEGTESGDTLPLFNSVTFGLRLNSRALRPGSKRISGIGEAAQANGLITSSGFLSVMETYRIQMKTILLSGVLSTFQPIVVKRVPYTVEGSDPARTAYRLPLTDEEFVFGNVVDCLTTTRVTHQTSRGNGR